MLEIIKTGKKNAPMIAIIGVDGSGKSTVLASFERNFRHASVQGVYVLNRHSERPAPGKVIRNYAAPPHSKLYSTLKLFIQIILWLRNYYLKLVPMRRAGIMILCDHFYFLGMALDPLKYRYGGSLWLANWILHRIPQPDFYIFLDAPLEIVYARKQEITRDEMRQLIKRHREYFTAIVNGFIVDASASLEDVITSVSEVIKQIIDLS